MSAARYIAATGTLAFSATAATVASTFYNTAGCEKAERDRNFRVEVYLMDKISQKSYLETAKEGIPSTLRILAIDLPGLRKEAFAGECHLAHDKIFVDDIAPSKIVEAPRREEDSKDGTNKKENIKLRIAQKALVKSLVQCQSHQSQQRVGVEVLEASVADLNRFKLRKTHQVGSFKYDPGKYYGSKKDDQNPSNGHDEIDEVDQDEILLNTAVYEDELEAPWNQYSWIEEMRLRIMGQVPFGAPMEKSTRFQRAFYGNVFKETVKPVHRWWEWPLPSFAKSDPDGLDGRNQTICRATSKPHAVIANGAALQRVPSSLRLLQKFCRKADVPLFVIDDPRVWGGNTHSSLGEALQEMRATIKNRVIGQALKQTGASAFTRGRLLGQAETEAKWQVKEKTQRAKDLITGEGRRRRKAAKEPQDWSRLDSNHLEKKLVERGIIAKKKERDSESNRNYALNFVEIARRCVNDEAQEVQANSKNDEVSGETVKV